MGHVSESARRRRCPQHFKRSASKAGAARKRHPPAAAAAILAPARPVSTLPSSFSSRRIGGDYICCSRLAPPFRATGLRAAELLTARFAPGTARCGRDGAVRRGAIPWRDTVARYGAALAALPTSSSRTPEHVPRPTHEDSPPTRAPTVSVEVGCALPAGERRPSRARRRARGARRGEGSLPRSCDGFRRCPPEQTRVRPILVPLPLRPKVP